MKREKRLKVGDEVEVTLKVKVIRVSDRHGLCYEVVLPIGYYANAAARTFFLDPEEITSRPLKRVK